MKRTMAILLGVGLFWMSSCGSDSDPITKGEYCDATGSAFCHRIETCQVATFNACFQNFKGACCINDGSCGQVAMDAAALRALESKCTAALSAEACSEAAASVVPAACLMNP